MMVELDKKTDDERGFLVEFLRGDELGPKFKNFGQIYVTTLSPEAIRGNHYHNEKIEWFSVFNGKVKVILEDIETKEREEFVLDSSKAVKRICIESKVAHAFKNISDKTVVLVAYTNKIYNPKNRDAYEYKLL